MSSLIEIVYVNIKKHLGIGDWGLGIGDWRFGDWGLGPIPNPQSPNLSEIQ